MTTDVDGKGNGFGEASLLARNRCALHLPHLSYVSGKRGVCCRTNALGDGSIVGRRGHVAKPSQRQQHSLTPSLPRLPQVPDYLTAAEEERLLREVHASQAKWVKVQHAQVMCRTTTAWAHAGCIGCSPSRGTLLNDSSLFATTTTHK